jgi:hypothetical protein
VACSPRLRKDDLRGPRVVLADSVAAVVRAARVARLHPVAKVGHGLAGGQRGGGATGGAGGVVVGHVSCETAKAGHDTWGKKEVGHETWGGGERWGVIPEGRARDEA